jgi:hypothetical protein
MTTSEVTLTDAEINDESWLRIAQCVVSAHAKTERQKVDAEKCCRAIERYVRLGRMVRELTASKGGAAGLGAAGAATR